MPQVDDNPIPTPEPTQGKDKRKRIRYKKRPLRARKQAKLDGLKFYSTGKPCTNGHLCDRRTSDGHCVECNKDKGKKNFHKNKERILAKRRTPEYRERRQEARRGSVKQKEHNKLYCKKWRLENPERHKELQDKSRNKPERKLLKKEYNGRPDIKKRNKEQMKAWRAKNPEKWKAICGKADAERRAVIEQSPSHYTSEDLVRIYKAQKGKCAYCRKPLSNKYQVDHIIPLKPKFGPPGTNEAKNVQLCCEKKEGHRSCNERKRNTDPIEYAQSLGRLL